MVNGKKNLKDNEFDLLTAWDVLEHIPKFEEYLKAINSILKKDGVMFCTLPNISSFTARISRSKWNCMLLEHLWYFNPNTFSLIVKRFGFEVLEAANISYMVDLGTILKRLKQTYGINMTNIIHDRFKNYNLHLPMGLMLIVSKKIDAVLEDHKTNENKIEC